jgi:hypothetical protein
LALARGREPSPSRDRVGEGKVTCMGHAAGQEGTRWPPSVLRKRRCVSIASLRSNATPKGGRSPERANLVTANPGSP